MAGSIKSQSRAECLLQTGPTGGTVGGTVSVGSSNFRGYDLDVFAYEGPVGSMAKRKGKPFRISMRNQQGLKFAHDLLGQLAFDANAAKELIELLVARTTFTAVESLELVGEVSKALVKKNPA